MSHYFAQAMFSWVLVSPTLSGNTLKVSIVSDHLQPLEVEVMVKIQRWDELETYHLQVLTAQVQAQSVKEIDLDFIQLLHNGRCMEASNSTSRFDYCFLTFQ